MWVTPKPSERRRDLFREEGEHVIHVQVAFVVAVHVGKDGCAREQTVRLVNRGRRDGGQARSLGQRMGSRTFAGLDGIERVGLALALCKRNSLGSATIG